MRLLKQINEMVSTSASRLILSALSKVDKHTNLDRYKPYHKNLKIRSEKGHPNLVTVTFPDARGVGVAKELYQELSKDHKIEDYNIDKMDDEVSLFMAFNEMNESIQITETKSLGKRVRIVRGEHKGKEGVIREIKHGAYRGAGKYFFIDLPSGAQANNIPGVAIRVIKESSTNDEFYRSIVHKAIRKTILLDKKDPQFVDQIEEILNQAVDEFKEEM